MAKMSPKGKVKPGMHMMDGKPMKNSDMKAKAKKVSKKK